MTVKNVCEHRSPILGRSFKEKYMERFYYGANGFYNSTEKIKNSFKQNERQIKYSASEHNAVASKGADAQAIPSSFIIITYDHH